MPTAAERDELYLQIHGLNVRPENLNKQVIQAVDQMRKMLYGEPTSELTGTELQILESGGFNVEPVLESDPAANAVSTYAALLVTSLDSAQAAERLGVKPTRVRQMLAERSLYGIRLDGRWYIPAFQFWPHGLIPNIGKVISVMDCSLHPLTVLRWFSLPTVDLEAAEGQAMSPLDWLCQGRAVEPVIAIARHV